MSSLKDLYTEIRTELEDITGIKYVRLWNNQFERENVNEAFQFPCCLIEFEPTECRDLLNGVQQYDFVVCIHLGFESYKTEDIDILDLKQQVFIKLGNFLSTTNMFSYLSRESETQNFDHDNIQDYQIRFKVTGKDFDGDTRPNTPVTVTVLTTNITLD
jgi:hypothetical protein